MADVGSLVMSAGGATANPYILGAGLAIKGIQGVGGFVRANKANKEIRKFGNPQFTVAPQYLSYYDQAVQDAANPDGLGQEVIGAVGQKIAGQTTQNINTAKAVGGGNITGQVNAALNNANVDAYTNLAIEDAATRARNRELAMVRVGQGAQMFQNVNNQNTQLKLDTLRAYGQSAQEGRMSANNALGDMANTAIGVGAMGLDPEMFTGKTTTQTAMPQFNYKPRTPSFNMFNKPTGFSAYPNVQTTATTNTAVSQEPMWTPPAQAMVPRYFTPYRFNPFNPVAPPR